MVGDVGQFSGDFGVGQIRLRLQQLLIEIWSFDLGQNVARFDGSTDVCLPVGDVAIDARKQRGARISFEPSWQVKRRHAALGAGRGGGDVGDRAGFSRLA